MSSRRLVLPESDFVVSNNDSDLSRKIADREEVGGVSCDGASVEDKVGELLLRAGGGKLGFWRNRMLEDGDLESGKGRGLVSK